MVSHPFHDEAAEWMGHGTAMAGTVSPNDNRRSFDGAKNAPNFAQDDSAEWEAPNLVYARVVGAEEGGRK